MVFEYHLNIFWKVSWYYLNILRILDWWKIEPLTSKGATQGWVIVSIFSIFCINFPSLLSLSHHWVLTFCQRCILQFSISEEHKPRVWDSWSHSPVNIQLIIRCTDLLSTLSKAFYLVSLRNFHHGRFSLISRIMISLWVPFLNSTKKLYRGNVHRCVPL